MSAAACGLRLGHALLWPTHLTPLCVARKPQQGEVLATSELLINRGRKSSLINIFSASSAAACEEYLYSLRRYVVLPRNLPERKDWAAVQRQSHQLSLKNPSTLMTALAGWIWALTHSTALLQREKQKCVWESTQGNRGEEWKDEKGSFFLQCLLKGKCWAQCKTGRTDMDKLLSCSCHRCMKTACPFSVEGSRAVQNSFNGNITLAVNLISLEYCGLFNYPTLAGDTSSNLFCCWKFRHTISFGITQDQHSRMPKTTTPVSQLAQLPADSNYTLPILALLTER